MKKILLSLLLAAGLGSMQAQPRTAQTLFHTGDSTGYPYRIPALAAAPNGDVIALSDLRPCGGDIGYGRVDIMGRTSRDCGITWSAPYAVIRGSGQGKDTGYGDACLVADRKRNELLLMCVSGDVPYWKSTVEHSQRFVSMRARYDKRSDTWVWDTDRMIDHTEHFYKDLFGGRINGMFMGSGRICQSSKIKVGKYYRLYGALCTHQGNFVVYSDDFGDTWNVLGDATRSCAPQGDEPKCEELPDGSVLLSSRKHGGRYFNIFRYTNAKKAQGEWGEPVDTRLMPGGIKNEGTPCNGEILILKAREDKTRRATWLALQSIPAGPNRSNVTIYYKVLDDKADYQTPEAFASDWDGSYQVSKTGSAYSTMVPMKNGLIGFFYEEEPANYQMVFAPLFLEDITRGKFHCY